MNICIAALSCNTSRCSAMTQKTSNINIETARACCVRVCISECQCVLSPATDTRFIYIPEYFKNGQAGNTKVESLKALKTVIMRRSRVTKDGPVLWPQSAAAASFFNFHVHLSSSRSKRCWTWSSRDQDLQPHCWLKWNNYFSTHWLTGWL